MNTEVIYRGGAEDAGQLQRGLTEKIISAALAPIDSAQLLTYLRLTGLSVGLLLNFNTVHLRQGIKSVVNTPRPLRPFAPSVPLR